MVDRQLVTSADLRVAHCEVPVETGDARDSRNDLPGSLRAVEGGLKKEVVQALRTSRAHRKPHGRALSSIHYILDAILIADGRRRSRIVQSRTLGG